MRFFADKSKIIMVLFGFSLGIFTAGFIYYFGFFPEISKSSQSSDTEESVKVGKDIEQNSDFLVIDVSGAVKSPGLYKLDPMSRVGDAVNIAGGILSSASIIWISEKINLAEKLNDGDKVYIPFEWQLEEQGSNDVQTLVKPQTSLKTDQKPSSEISEQPKNLNPQSSPENNTLIKINKADQEALDSLPGIGAAYVQKLLQNRPFKDFSDLLNRSGIPQYRLEDIKDLIEY